MKVGDMVMFESDVPYSQRWKGSGLASIGIVIAELPGDHIIAHAVSVLWSSGELVERCPPRILEVISENR